MVITRSGSDREGMRPAGLAETTHQHRVGRFQEDYLGRNQAPDRLQDLRKIFQLRAFTDVHYQGGAADLARLDG